MNKGGAAGMGASEVREGKVGDKGKGTTTTAVGGFCVGIFCPTKKSFLL